MWNFAKEKITKERGELPPEGDAVKDNEAMHEEDFWSSWLREDERERSKEERQAKAEKWRRKGEKRTREEEDETETVKRRSEGCVSVEAFEICSQGKDLECYGALPWRDPLEELDESLFLVSWCVRCLM